MNKKTLLLLSITLIAAFALGFGGIWFMLADKPQNEEHQGSSTTGSIKEQTSPALTATVDFFQLILPCKRDAEGNTPIAHADFQMVVPIAHRLRIEEKASRLRDIIATLLRNSEVDAIHRDMEGFKQEIIRRSRQELDVEITEILVLRFDYDILRAKR